MSMAHDVHNDPTDEHAPLAKTWRQDLEELEARMEDRLDREIKPILSGMRELSLAVKASHVAVDASRTELVLAKTEIVGLLREDLNERNQHKERVLALWSRLLSPFSEDAVVRRGVVGFFILLALGVTGFGYVEYRNAAGSSVRMSESNRIHLQSSEEDPAQGVD